MLFPLESREMSQRSGSQVLKFRTPTGKVIPVTVELVNGTLVSKREAQRVLRLVLNRTGCPPSFDRQARAIVSTWAAQGCLERAEGRRRINEGLIDVRSFEVRVSSHMVAAAAASRANGKNRKQSSQRARIAPTLKELRR